jgi:hypothetical protein
MAIQTMTGLYIRLRIQDVFGRKSQKLNQLVLELIGLRKSLEELMSDKLNNNKDSLDRIVQFFALIAPWDDRLTEIRQILRLFEKVNYGQYNLLIFNLNSLSKHFKNAGRDICGYNRTDIGQPVTNFDVFLGGVEEINLNTHSVSTWKTKEEETPGIDTRYNLVSKIAEEFMDSHIQLLLYIILALESF